MRTLITTYIIDTCIDIICDRIGDNLKTFTGTGDSIVDGLIEHLKNGCICEVDSDQYYTVSKYLDVDIIDSWTFPADHCTMYDIALSESYIQ